MKPRLHFHGAAGMVTGSCFLVETGEAKVLVDCGLFQGSKTEKELNYRPFPFRAEALDAVLLTHAHIDHSGLLPKLVKDGFAGDIHATAPTMDLCGVMLADSAHIQELEVTQLNRRNPRRGKGEVAPIYTSRHVEACMARFRPVAYREWIAPAPGIRARFWNAGHLLGSASIELEIAGAEPGETLRIMFSGDIGPAFKLLHGDPEAPAGFDHVLCESTYGATDRQEASPAARRIRLREELRAAENPAGAVIIPSFAVERTQELLTDLVGLMDAGEVGRAPIVIDSPLAARASEVFRRHAHEMEQGEALVRALASPQVRFTQSVEESIALDQLRGFHIVIAASGMCEAGRIRHRLRNWLWRPEATILFVGFQAQGTLGRILLDGAPDVRIQGDEVKVRARLRSLDLYSGHADGPELASWIRDRRPIAGKVFLTHGEPASLAGLEERLAASLAPGQVVRPVFDDAWELSRTDAVRVEAGEPPPRLRPDQVARLDWHNELSELILDIGRELDLAADERSKKVVLRRLRRALKDGAVEGDAPR
ncbi:MAG: MBL fold metallo-hydrolase [Bauldia sp.]|nr:MBL fold metallo-hydrolase [Bauldia sp.]